MTLCTLIGRFHALYDAAREDRVVSFLRCQPQKLLKHLGRFSCLIGIFRLDAYMGPMYTQPFLASFTISTDLRHSSVTSSHF